MPLLQCDMHYLSIGNIVIHGDLLMGKPLYTVAKFLEAIRGDGREGSPTRAGCGGIITTVARRVGCDWHTASKWINEHDTLKRAFQDERERVLDLCETKLIDAINSGDIDSAKWMLSRLGRNRGYVERQEVTGKDGGPVQSLDLSKLTNSQLERLARGEDVSTVLANPGES
jgi:hypothetical protein